MTGRRRSETVARTRDCWTLLIRWAVRGDATAEERRRGGVISPLGSASIMGGVLLVHCRRKDRRALYLWVEGSAVFLPSTPPPRGWREATITGVFFQFISSFFPEYDWAIFRYRTCAERSPSPKIKPPTAAELQAQVQELQSRLREEEATRLEWRQKAEAAQVQLMDARAAQLRAEDAAQAAEKAEHEALQKAAAERPSSSAGCLWLPVRRWPRRHWTRLHRQATPPRLMRWQRRSRH